MTKQRMRVGARTFDVSNVDKVLFPGDGVTKGQLIDHYVRLADLILPHLQDRPIAMERYPDGIEKTRIFHKDVPSYFPDWIPRVRVEKRGGSLQQLVCTEAATLAYIANQACITPHAFLSRADDLNAPDQLMVDLDPYGGDFEQARRAAFSVRTLLDELRLPAFVKTTGGNGLHVVVPLDRRADFEETRTFAFDAASVLVDREPELFTLEFRKDRRGDRLFLDLMRNNYAQTAAPPWSVRARPGAPVGVPLEWDELEDAALRPDRFTLASLEHLPRDDPWKGMRRRARSLGPARKRLDALRV